MYAVTSYPLVSRTRATFRRAEFGFFGVVVYTRVHTPRFCGFFCSAGDLFFLGAARRPLRTSWLIVGIDKPGYFFRQKNAQPSRGSGAEMTEAILRRTDLKN